MHVCIIVVSISITVVAVVIVVISKKLPYYGTSSRKRKSFVVVLSPRHRDDRPSPPISNDVPQLVVVPAIAAPVQVLVP